LSSAEQSLNEEERAAFSGGVWDDDEVAAGAASARRPTGLLDDDDDDDDDVGATAGADDAFDAADEPTNVRPVLPKPARSELSTSLSQMLDDSDEQPRPARGAPRRGRDVSSVPGPTAPQVPSAKAPLTPMASSSASSLQQKRPRVVIDSAEENTAFRPPPAPMAAPVGPLRAAPSSSSSASPSQAPPAAIDSSFEEATAAGRLPSMASPVVARPTPAADAPRVGAADDLFPDDDDFSQPTLPPMTASVAAPRPSPQPSLTGAFDGEEDDESLEAADVIADSNADDEAGDDHDDDDGLIVDENDPNKTGWYEPGGISAPSQEVEGFVGGLPPTDQVAAIPRNNAGGARPRPSLDMTMPPSVEAAVDDDSSAWSDSGMPPRRPQPPPPEPSRFEPRPGTPGSIGSLGALSAVGPTNVAPFPSSSSGSQGSSEILDSAMVIRPAIKAVPLALARKGGKPEPPRAERNERPGTPPPIADDDDDFMVDPDATMNLPPLPRSKEGEARKRRAPSEVSGPVMREPPREPAKENRRAPTEDMRRKARNLMEQAQQDHAVGRLGAARMNAKLATIYDPDNDAYRKILADWEERPKAGGAGSGVSSAINSRPEYVQLYETAQELEDDDDIDGALEMLEKGLRLAPNAAAFHNRIGVILAMRKRDFERAADEIQKAIALEPDNPHYRNNLGKVMSRANKRRSPATGTDAR
ncbi:MAG TPA: hypothetical protein VGF99_20555, partial [Myxococcota bacterium]